MFSLLFQNFDCRGNLYAVHAFLIKRPQPWKMSPVFQTSVVFRKYLDQIENSYPLWGGRGGWKGWPRPPLKATPPTQSSNLATPWPPYWDGVAGVAGVAIPKPAPIPNSFPIPKPAPNPKQATPQPPLSQKQPPLSKLQPPLSIHGHPWPPRHPGHPKAFTIGGSYYIL